MGHLIRIGAERRSPGFWQFTSWLLVVASCQTPAPTAEAPSVPAQLPALPALEGRADFGNPQGCLESEDAAGFVYADQVVPREAAGFSVRYEGNVKWLTVGLPGAGGRKLRYALVQCGTPPPADAHGAVVVEVPVRRFVTASTTELPAVVMLDVVDRLIGHGTLRYVSSPEIRQRIESGAIFEAGPLGSVDVERVIAAGPDVFFADTYGDAELGGGAAFEALAAVGVPVVAVPSYLETSPLGRAEWLLFVAFFVNREALAADLFDQVAARYRQLADRGRRATTRPTAITSGPLGEVWHVPGGRSYMATLLADAGYDYLWSEDESVGSLALAFEAAWQRARRADFWVHPGAWRSRAEIAGVDARLATLPALEEGNVIVNDARLNAGGGNDFWESGNARPDLVLADLLLFAHPELIPEHRPIYLRRLGGDLVDRESGRE